MNKALSIAGKTTAATILIGIVGIGLCLFAESNRTYYPPTTNRQHR